MAPALYNEYSTYLKKMFGCRVQKIPLDAGLTCPNRDGSKGIGGCLYCDARGSGTGAHTRLPSISEQLRRGKDFFGKRYGAEKFIAYFQSFSNTYAPLDLLEKIVSGGLGPGRRGGFGRGDPSRLC